MIIETRLKRLEEQMEKGFSEIRQLICGRNILGNWVMQDMACAMINVKPSRLRQIRIHIDKRNNQTVGCIRWRKGKGRTAQYHKADLEKYLSEITIA